MISNDPTHSASVVYNGAMAEPKSSTGNTAMRSTPTGADTALARASGSEPMTCFSCSTFPLANASLTR